MNIVICDSLVKEEGYRGEERSGLGVGYRDCRVSLCDGFGYVRLILSGFWTVKFSEIVYGVYL